MKCPETANSVLLSPEQGVFGYGSIDLLAGDEDDDVFDPYVLFLLSFFFIPLEEETSHFNKS